MKNETRMRSGFFAALPVLALILTGHAAVASTDSVGPAIVLPDCLKNGSQLANTPIDVSFVTAPDTPVDLSSLHVWIHKFIGWVDVTDRLRQHPNVRVSGWGIHLDGGILPVGEHLVRVSFRDMKGRIAEATQTIRIAPFGRQA